MRLALPFFPANREFYREFLTIGASWHARDGSCSARCRVLNAKFPTRYNRELISLFREFLLTNRIQPCQTPKTISRNRANATQKWPQPFAQSRNAYSVRFGRVEAYKMRFATRIGLCLDVSRYPEKLSCIPIKNFRALFLAE
jgi:hypothetical protein